MNEEVLFDAYRGVFGYSAQCACLGWIEAPTDDDVPAAVECHNASPEHQAWRTEQDAVEALQRKPVRVCPCQGHASGVGVVG